MFFLIIAVQLNNINVFLLFSDIFSISLLLLTHLLKSIIRNPAHCCSPNDKHDLPFRLIADLIIKSSCAHRFALHDAWAIGYIPTLAESFDFDHNRFFVVWIIRFLFKLNFHAFFHELCSVVMTAACDCKIHFFHNCVHLSICLFLRFFMLRSYYRSQCPIIRSIISIKIKCAPSHTSARERYAQHKLHLRELRIPTERFDS